MNSVNRWIRLIDEFRWCHDQIWNWLDKFKRKWVISDIWTGQTITSMIATPSADLIVNSFYVDQLMNHIGHRKWKIGEYEMRL